MKMVRYIVLPVDEFEADDELEAICQEELKEELERMGAKGICFSRQYDGNMVSVIATGDIDKEE